MRHFLHTIIVWLLLAGVVPAAYAVVEPFVKADWGATPGQVMEATGLPSFSKIDFEAKRTDYLAYRQTIDNCSFVFYYYFTDEKLVRVKLTLREAPNDAALIEAAANMGRQLAAVLGDSTAEVETGPTPAGLEPEPVTALLWQTPDTFAALIVEELPLDGRPVFNAVIADANNPVNGELVAEYQKLVGQLTLPKAEEAADAELTVETAAVEPTEPVYENLEPRRFNVPTQPEVKEGFIAMLSRKLQALASGALDNLLLSAAIVVLLVILVVVLILLKRKRRADEGTAQPLKAKKAAADKAEKKSLGRRFTRGKAVGEEDELDPDFTSQKPRQLRMVSASKTGSSKGTKLKMNKK